MADQPPRTAPQHELEQKLRKLAHAAPDEAAVLFAAADAVARIVTKHEAFKARLASIDGDALHAIASLGEPT